MVFVTVNPSASISSGTNPSKFPILIIAVFSQLVLRPESSRKDSTIFFSLFRDSISNIVATVLSSAKQSDLSVSRLLSFSNCGSSLIGPGKKARGLIDFICRLSSILNSNICAAKLYRRGEGLSPCAWPFHRLNFSEVRFCPSIT